MTALTHPTAASFRRDFPLLNRAVNGRPLVYLDNAATAQKPHAVLEAMDAYYRQMNSNVHRGVHTLSQEATAAMEDVRDAFKEHLGAAQREEIIFTKGVTEGINLVASGYGQMLKPEDEIVVSGLEHHSNIVPWQLACERSGARLRVIPLLEDQTLNLEAYQSILAEGRVKLVAVNHISNAIGTVNPIAEMARLAHDAGALILVDGAQAGPHMQPRVDQLAADYYVLSGHKMFGPTGIGVLYGKREYLERLPVYQGGGEMIRTVSFEKTTYADLPFRFEAGTPAIAEIIGLGAALNYMNRVGFEVIAQRDKELMAYAEERLLALPGLKMYGPKADRKAGVHSFSLEGIHPFDVGTILDQLGIAVRTGHHCAQPLMDHLGLPGTIRASIAFYNAPEEIDALAEGLRRAQTMLS